MQSYHIHALVRVWALLFAELIVADAVHGEVLLYMMNVIKTQIFTLDPERDFEQDLRDADVGAYFARQYGAKD
jgi:hypothetical protein